MSQALTPEVVWAQRSNADDETKNILYITINAPDVANEKLKFSLQPTKLLYEGTNVKGTTYHLEFEFFEEIDPQESRHHHTLRGTECIIRKKQKKVEYWPRLLKDKARVHWLKTNFDKWVDEDEQEGAPEEPGFDPSMMSQFGGGDDAGGFGNIDFSKLGAGQGLSGQDMADNMGDAASSDDDDMPDLEPAEEELAGVTAAAGEGKKTAAGGKIEEL